MTCHVYLVEKEYKFKTKTTCKWKYGLTTQAHYRKRSSAYKDCFRWEEVDSTKTARRFEAQMKELLYAYLINERGCRVLSNIFRYEEVDQYVPFDVVAACWDVAFEHIVAGEMVAGFQERHKPWELWFDQKIDKLQAEENKRAEALIALVQERLIEQALAMEEPKELEPMWA